MLRKFLFAVLFMCAIAPAVADTGCPIGYGYQPPMVFIGSNLNNATTITGGVTQNGERITNDARYRTNNFTEISVEFGKAYTVATNESKSSIVLATYDANHNFIERVNVSDNNYVCDSGVSYVVPTLYVNDENKWQYSVADTEILFLDTPLRKVGDYADVLDYNNGTITRNVGVKVLDGSENWNFRDTLGFNEPYLYEPTLRFKPGQTDFLIGISSHFQGGVTSGLPPVNSFRICPYESALNQAMFDFNIGDIASTLAEFKSWLAQQYENGTPVTVYYPLATPVVENVNLSSYTRYELPVVDGDCSLCPPNTYKDFVGNEQCTPCPDRLISPSGAISVNECGRVLRVGGRFTFMPVGRRTEHGLCTMLNGVKYCADLYEKE